MKDLRKSIKSLAITHVIISAEPISHKTYLDELNDLDVKILINKPFVLLPYASLDSSVAKRMVIQSCELAESVNEHRKLFFNISRRWSEVFDEFLSVSRSFTSGVSSVQVFYADGEFRNVNGIEKRWNHPFRLGYGSVGHSTFHPLDAGLALLSVEDLEQVAEVVCSVFSASAGDYLASSHGEISSYSVVDDVPASVEFDIVANFKIVLKNGATVLLSLTSLHNSPHGGLQSNSKAQDFDPQSVRLTQESYRVVHGHSGFAELSRYEAREDRGISDQTRPKVQRRSRIYAQKGWDDNLVDREARTMEVFSREFYETDIMKSGQYRCMKNFLIGELDQFGASVVVSQVLLSLMFYAVATKGKTVSLKCNLKRGIRKWILDEF